MLVNASSLIAIQSYSTQQTLDRAGSAAERTSVKPGVLDKTVERGQREPFVLLELSDEAAKIARQEPPAPLRSPSLLKDALPQAVAEEPAPNKFLREAPKADAQPVFTRPGTNLDISI